MISSRSVKAVVNSGYEIFLEESRARIKVEKLKFPEFRTLSPRNEWISER